MKEILIMLSDLMYGQYLNTTDAAYRFYRSKREEESIKRRGKQDGKAKAKRRHERLLRVRDSLQILEG